MELSNIQYFTNRGLDAKTIKEDLVSHDTDRESSAIKQVIANMTIGKDMTQHFNDVARLVTSPSLEIKKLVYLYLMQNAKSQPEKAVLQAGTFVKDTTHESPLIRCIALRTLTSMLVPAMVEFTQAPLLKSLRDPDPYVRCTAALGVLKMYHLAPRVVEGTAILHTLIDLLSDAVAAVVAAAACSLCEIRSIAVDPTASKITEAILSHTDALRVALADSSEWAHLSILEALALVFVERPTEQRLEGAELVLKTVLLALQAQNPAVVMAAVKVVVTFLLSYCGPQSPLRPIQQAELEKRYTTKVVQPLVSLIVGVRFEIRWVALRFIRLLAQRYKDPFIPFVSSFFVKYDDPVYIKLEKLDIMAGLATMANGATILSELAEYSQEVDIEFVRKSVRCIGLLAVKLEGLASQCVEHVVKLISSRVNYVVQEAAVVVQTVLRQYPNRYEGIIVQLCQALDVLDDPESKEAVVWVVGEYADRVENAAEILQMFFEAFMDEPLTVQLAVLTATVKVYLKGVPNKEVEHQQCLEKVLALATNSDTPDLRDRAYFYWRLILADPAGAQKVVFAPKDPITDTGLVEKNTLRELLGQAGYVSCVIGKPAAAFLGDGALPPVQYDAADEEMSPEISRMASNVQPQDAAPSLPAAAPAASPAIPAGVIDKAFDFSNDASYIHDLPQLHEEQPLQLVLDAARGQGLEVSMAWVPTALYPLLAVKFQLTQSAVTSVKIITMQLNANVFGITIAQDFPETELHAINNSTHTMRLALSPNNHKRPHSVVQVALKVDPLGVLFFDAPVVSLRAVLVPATGYNLQDYSEEFKRYSVAWSMPPAEGPLVSPANLTAAHLQQRGINVVHVNEGADNAALKGLHLQATTIANQKIFAQVTVDDWKVVLLTVRSTDDNIAELFGRYLLECFTAS